MVAHLVVFFSAPWFHAHPGEDHAETKGEAYHSHLPPFASHSSEHDEEAPQDDDLMHLWAMGNWALQNWHGVPAAHAGNIPDSAQYSSDINCISLPPALASHQPFLFRNLIIQNPADYYALNAANLSPPQA